MKLILLLTFYSIVAFANLEEGYYPGKTIDRDKVELHLVKHPARPDSFMALIVNEGGYGYAYQVDHFETGTYGMVPLQVLDTAMIGFENPNPSLSLKVVPKRGDMVIQIVSNGDANKYGFKYTTMEFPISRKKTVRWVKHMPGWFKYDSNREKVQVGTQNNENESTFVANSNIINGDYTLREVKPYLNLPLRLELASTGINILEVAEGMVAFIKGNNVLGDDGMYYLLKDGRVFYFERVSR